MKAMTFSITSGLTSEMETTFGLLGDSRILENMVDLAFRMTEWQ